MHDAHAPFAVVEAAERRRLLRRAAEGVSAADPAAVLDLGAAVLLHRAAHLELAARLPTWLDPSVLARLGDEQRRLSLDLELLGELFRGGAAEDVAVLAAALVGRLRRHLDDDERVLERPLGRLIASWQSPPADAVSRARLLERGEV